MNDKDLKRNGSGYYDPTAYKAMKNYENGGGNMEINKGEVWEVEHGRYIKTAIVLAHHGSYCSVLLLEDEYRESRNIQINARGMKYSESGFVQYKFTNAFVSFVRTLTVEEFEDVCIKVAKSLDLPDTKNEAFENAAHELVAEKKAEIESLKAELEDTKKLAQEMKAERDMLRYQQPIEEPQEVAVLKAQLEIYKQQNEMMFNKLIGA